MVITRPVLFVGFMFRLCLWPISTTLADQMGLNVKSRRKNVVKFAKAAIKVAENMPIKNELIKANVKYHNLKT